MDVIFMGTGTSQGVPMVACDCRVCQSTDPRDKRNRTSIHVVMGGVHIQVDAAQEFRLQCLAHDVRQVDLFILTHGHADHILGMDDLRRFCDLRGGDNLPVYSTPAGLERVSGVFPYAILDKPLVRGYPAFALREMPEILDTPGGLIRSTLLPHGPLDVLGLLFEEAGTGARLVYYTDCKVVSPAQREMASEADAVILDALRFAPHPGHMNLEEAIETALSIGAPATYFTHLTHDILYQEVAPTLPKNVFLSQDGLRLRL